MSPRAGICLLVALAVAATAFACGGSSTAPSATPGSGSGAGASTGPTITISSAGVSPKSITVAPGSQVTFVNNDTVEHLMFSDPHPEHTDCPEINQVGYLAPGQSRQTGNLNTVRSCGFHDHEHPDAASLKGTIVIHP